MLVETVDQVTSVDIYTVMVFSRTNVDFLIDAPSFPTVIFNIMKCVASRRTVGKGFNASLSIYRGKLF